MNSFLLFSLQFSFFGFCSTTDIRGGCHEKEAERSLPLTYHRPLYGGKGLRGNISGDRSAFDGGPHGCRVESLLLGRFPLFLVFFLTLFVPVSVLRNGYEGEGCSAVS